MSETVDRGSPMALRRRAFLAGTAAAGATASGLSRPAAQTARTVTLWTWGGADRFAPRLAAFQRLYPEIARRTNIEVASPGRNDGEVYQALRLALASGNNVPDLVQMNYIGVPEFAEANVLTDVGQYLRPYGGDLVDAAKQLSSYAGQTVCVPYQLKGKIWLYRRDLCEAANIDIGRISTFDDYMAAGRQFRERHPRSYLMNIGRKPIHWLYFMILSHWDGVQIADRNGRFRLTTDPAFARLLTWLKTWKDSGIAFNTDDFEPDWQPAFADGTIAGSLIATWMTDFLPRFAPQQGGRWGIALWPEFNRSGSEAGGAVFAIPARARNKEAAFEFLAKMFLEPTGAADEWQRTGNPAVIRSVRPELLERSRTMTRPDGITDAAWATNPGNFFGRDFMQPVFDSFDAFRVFPYDPAAQRELDIMRQHTEAHLAGTKTLEAALRDMEADMRRQIGNPYRP